jgi:predicted exporter
MKRTPLALFLLALWVVVLVAAGAYAQRHLSVRNDLRLFLPKPATAVERLLLEGIGEGPATRVLVVALEGAPPERLADASRALAEALRTDEAFLLVANGDFALDSFPDELLPYRFLLSPTLDTHSLDRDYLSAALAARARDLESPAGLFLEPWLPRDPTLELLGVLQRWLPTQEPRREFDVWFDRGGMRALLLAETRAPAFDPDAQRAALDRLDGALAAVGAPGVKMTASGAGAFSALMEARTSAEAQTIGLADTVGMIVLLLIAYRGVGSVVLAALPLVTAGIAGIAAVSALFGPVHGITLAFGFTLIGVAQDYPLHLLSHRSVDRPPEEIARGLWPTLATGVASTCIAYFTFLFSGVLGLEELACFTVAGLAAAGLTSRFVLPWLVASPTRDYGDSRWLERLWSAIVRLPRARSAPFVLIAGCFAVVAFAREPFWNNDLRGLTPVPADLLAADQRLRADLGTADLRYLLAVNGANVDAVLVRLEALEPMLDALVARGAIDSYDDAARYLPSAGKQRTRQAALPDERSLRAALDAATAATEFRVGVFEPFLADVAKARTLPPLTVDKLRELGLGAGVDPLLARDGARVAALVTFSGVKDLGALRDLAAAESDATLLDLRQASESLVARERGRMLVSLAVASVALVAVIAFSLRSRRRLLRVLAPMAITTLVVVAVLRGAGISFTLFHLISLILVAGLGLDYALFFEHAADDPVEQRRTLHAVLVCSISTLFVFALLAASSLPVLRAIGLPVTIGVVSNFFLALYLTTPRETRPSPRRAERHGV